MFVELNTQSDTNTMLQLLRTSARSVRSRALFKRSTVLPALQSLQAKRIGRTPYCTTKDNNIKNTEPIDPRERDPQFQFQGTSKPPQTTRGAVDDFDLGSQLDKPLIVVNGYGPKTFRINGEDVAGSVLLFRDAYFSWNAEQFSDVTTQSLIPIQLHQPTPQLLLVGSGPTIQRLPPSLTDHFKELGIVVEVMNTPTALATFNFLNQEERSVAAALLVMEPNESK